MSDLRVGVDIGGTFTDGVLVDCSSGKTWTAKVLSTPMDPSVAFITVVERLAALARISMADVNAVIHATTVATNAVIQRTGAPTGLLVTAGFRDVLEIGRQVRHELYNLQTDKPVPLVPRQAAVEVIERLDHLGRVVVPLNEESVARAVAVLRAQGVSAIAICLLHGYRNPVHENRVAELLRELYPEAAVSISSDVAPEIREFWRASTTVMNAYVEPVVGHYLDAVESKLSQLGMRGTLRLMRSNGGMMTTSKARAHPVHLIESGPAAGVAAASYYAHLAGSPHVLSFDMGGTTAKMGLIRDGQPRIVSEFEVGAGSWSGTTLVKGSGYPILSSVVDLVEVGAGGGSIAWIDSGGSLRVGPMSAGADPGPVCYAQGGTKPTVTDANLTLGRLNKDYFLGGEMTLDSAAAARAIDSQCAQPLGLSTQSAAHGITEIANATMVEAIRLVSVHRGHDPREFALVVFGGAGPLHADSLAQELQIPLVIVPPTPGVASALGLLVSDLRLDYSVTRLEPLESADFDAIDDVFARVTTQASDELNREGITGDKVIVQRFLEMRYVGQSWKLRVGYDSNSFNGERPNTALKRPFDEMHEQAYGYAVPDEACEIVNLVATVTGSIVKPRPARLERGSRDSSRALNSRRPVMLDRNVQDVCAVFDRYRLLEGNVIYGPALIEEPDSTTFVNSGRRADVGRFGLLLITKQ